MLLLHLMLQSFPLPPVDHYFPHAVHSSASDSFFSFMSIKIPLRFSPPPKLVIKMHVPIWMSPPLFVPPVTLIYHNSTLPLSSLQPIVPTETQYDQWGYRARLLCLCQCMCMRGPLGRGEERRVAWHSISLLSCQAPTPGCADSTCCLCSLKAVFLSSVFI